jgi:tetratricopeptide (TPR) repeat protein
MLGRALVLFALIFVAAPDFALSQTYLSDCNSSRAGGPSPEDIIKACSAALASGTLNSEDTAVALVDRGAAYQHTNQLDFAVADYNAALKIDPKMMPAHVDLATIAAQRGDLQQAKQEVDQALHLKSKDPVALALRCHLRALDDDAADAIPDCDESIELRPQDANAWTARATAELKLGKQQEAKADCDSALQMNPTLPAAYYLRGIAEHRLGNIKDGDSDMQMAKGMAQGIDLYYARYGITP